MLIKCFIMFLLAITSPLIGQYNISIAAIFRDDADYLKEWIEYHLLIGVDHFYLYNHFSSDHYLEVLQPYIDNETVTLTEWSYEYKERPEWLKIQCNAYEHALNVGRRETKWLALIDTDEFVVPTDYRDMKEFLADFDQYAGVVLHWQMFGDSGVNSIPDDALMIELLTYRAPSNYMPRTEAPYLSGNEFRKPIVKPSLVQRVGGPHHVIYIPGKTAVNTRKLPAKLPVCSKIEHKGAQLNHYWCRDRNGFRKKIEKSTLRYNIPLTLKRAIHLNQRATVKDERILRFVPDLKKKMKLHQPVK